MTLLKAMSLFDHPPDGTPSPPPAANPALDKHSFGIALAAHLTLVLLALLFINLPKFNKPDPFAAQWVDLASLNLPKPTSPEPAPKVEESKPIEKPVEKKPVEKPTVKDDTAEKKQADKKIAEK